MEAVFLREPVSHAVSELRKKFLDFVFDAVECCSRKIRVLIRRVAERVLEGRALTRALNEPEQNRLCDKCGALLPETHGSSLNAAVFFDDVRIRQLIHQRDVDVALVEVDGLRSSNRNSEEVEIVEQLTKLDGTNFSQRGSRSKDSDGEGERVSGLEVAVFDKVEGTGNPAETIQEDAKRRLREVEMKDTHRVGDPTHSLARLGVVGSERRRLHQADGNRGERPQREGSGHDALENVALRARPSLLRSLTLQVLIQFLQLVRELRPVLAPGIMPQEVLDLRRLDLRLEGDKLIAESALNAVHGDGKR